ncbi:zinc dependent phospholipase C family protein [Pontibacter indicus]|uniref:Zinc dependent phospholipase C n=1 Tax=Pontibacter indicus TaxID=1317125 RepID=A0A1R3XTG3_9BACT|nr:zinc dependent phospholipase C family protein [Pontibacter indicus]SIT95147.1 Zinc dependent phospholipase C [Pontibacter indicus]
MNYRTLSRSGFLALFLYLLLTASDVRAYGVLTHQTIIDAAWKDSMEPLLRKRFPKATEEDLKKAQAHAYGGSIVQDMGYFPFGNTFFTDLTHYVRSGDFVENLLRSATTIEEYGFALGALSHYNADIHGHPLGTNKAVALVYPKVGAAFGKEVTYAEDAASHIKTEFGFDVLQVARGNYAPEAYQSFIGFEVSKELLERAFLETYGLELNDVFMNVPLAIGTYRYTIRSFMPDLTKAAWQAKKSDIQEASPGITRRKFQYHMSRAEFNQAYGTDYDRPNLLARFSSWIIKVLPKLGPFQTLAFKPPTPEAEKLFYHSFNTTVENYKMLIKQLRQQDQLKLANMQLDTGGPSKPGDYKLTDETYAELLHKLAKSDFKQTSSALRHDILQFYQSRNAMKEVEQEDRAKLKEDLKKLQAFQL